MNKETQTIHQEYGKAVRQARNQNYLNNTLTSLSAPQKEVIKTLGLLSDMCGGDQKLSQLFQVCLMIKNQK